MSAPSLRAFSTSYDDAAKVISAVCTFVLVAAAVVSQSVALEIIFTLLLVGVYAWSPLGYSIEGRAIRVHRRSGDAVLPLDDIREARIATAGDLSGCIRLFGNGGLFGYYGLFSTARLGKCTWYVTNRAHTVVVVTARKTALFSPDDMDGFLSAIQSDLGAPGGLGFPCQSPLTREPY